MLPDSGHGQMRWLVWMSTHEKTWCCDIRPSLRGLRQRAPSGRAAADRWDLARQIMSGSAKKRNRWRRPASFAPVLLSRDKAVAPFLVAIVAQYLQKSWLRHAQADVHQMGSR